MSGRADRNTNDHISSISQLFVLNIPQRLFRDSNRFPAHTHGGFKTIPLNSLSLSLLATGYSLRYTIIPFASTTSIFPWMKGFFRVCVSVSVVYVRDSLSQQVRSTTLPFNYIKRKSTHQVSLFLFMFSTTLKRRWKVDTKTIWYFCSLFPLQFSFLSNNNIRDR